MGDLGNIDCLKPLIRLAFLLIGALAGSGVLAYIVAALVMPEAQEAAE